MTSQIDNSFEEFRFLCMLHNIGATKPEKALSIDEISGWISQEAFVVEQKLKDLVEMGFVKSVQVAGVDKYHVTLEGLRKVLSSYS